MDDQEAIYAEWETFRSQVAGSDDPNTEQLNLIFTGVRVAHGDDTRVRWARDPRTRTFCDLGLHLMYQHHVRPNRDGRKDTQIFADLGAQNLYDHAQRVFRDSEVAEQLTVSRFNETWARHPVYCQDLLAYLFRVAPYLRRLKKLHPEVEQAAQDLTLGEWLRHVSKLELDSVMANRLVSLHTLVETVRPTDPTVREYVHRLRGARLAEWARLYEKVFTAYGVLPRGERDWLSIAEGFSTVASGAFVRSQTRGDGQRSGVDGDMLGQLVTDLVPSMFIISADDVETRFADVCLLAEESKP